MCRKNTVCKETCEKQHQDALTTVARRGNRKERGLQRVQRYTVKGPRQPTVTWQGWIWE